MTDKDTIVRTIHLEDARADIIRVTGAYQEAVKAYKGSASERDACTRRFASVSNYIYSKYVKDEGWQEVIETAGEIANDAMIIRAWLVSALKSCKDAGIVVTPPETSNPAPELHDAIMSEVGTL